MPLSARAATASDASKLAQYVRQEDEQEWWASGVDDFQHALRNAVMVGNMVRVVVTPEDWPLVMYGCDRIQPYSTVGLGWMVATTQAVTMALPIHGLLHKEWALYDAEFNAIVAYADVRNRLHHNWMEWLGFRKLNDKPVAHARGQFLEYMRMKPCA
jgi:hypothetical protein